MFTDMPTKTSAIQRELKQNKPFSTIEEEAGVTLFRTVDVIRGEMERKLGADGITLQQFNVLRILRGSHPEAMPTLEIADRMIERAPGITRLLDRLEAAKLVNRKRCREDRRRVLCSITPAGLAALVKVEGPLREIGRQRLGRLSKADLASLMELLDRLREDTS